MREKHDFSKAQTSDPHTVKALSVGFGQMDFITLNRSSKTKTLRVLIRAYVRELMRMRKKASKPERIILGW